jgi:hypothetical protein
MTIGSPVTVPNGPPSLRLRVSAGPHPNPRHDDSGSEISLSAQSVNLKCPGLQAALALAKWARASPCPVAKTVPAVLRWLTLHDCSRCIPVPCSSSEHPRPCVSFAVALGARRRQRDVGKPVHGLCCIKLNLFSDCVLHRQPRAVHRAQRAVGDHRAAPSRSACS